MRYPFLSVSGDPAHAEAWWLLLPKSYNTSIFHRRTAFIRDKRSCMDWPDQGPGGNAANGA